MIYVTPIIFFIIVLADAIVNWYLIEKKDRKINHIVEGFWYMGICVTIACLLYFVLGVELFPLIVFSVLTRLTFFDPLLLLFRKKPLSYEGGEKPDSEKSIYDRLEKWFGIDVIWLRLIYLILYIGYLIFYLTRNVSG